MYPDSTEWNGIGIGILHTVPVHPNVAALQAGRNHVLEAALRTHEPPLHLPRSPQANEERPDSKSAG